MREEYRLAVVRCAKFQSVYPIYFRDVIQGGDLPVFWSNIRYLMLSMNMGHGDRVMTDKTQSQFIEDAVSWVAQLTAIKKTADNTR